MPRSLGYLGIVFVAMIWSMTGAAKVQATEAYATVTGQECRACHIDPLGGGTLTERGKGYLLSISHFRVRKIYVDPVGRL